MNTTEQIENAKAALGFHPDSDTNIADEISRIRDEGRDHFHTVTKQLDVIAELRRQIATYKEDQRVSSEAYNFLHGQYRSLYHIAHQLSEALHGNCAGCYTQHEETILTDFDHCLELPKKE